jgi:hypothetical protein
MSITDIVIFAIVIFALVWLIFRLRGNSRNPNKLQMTMDMISSINEDIKILGRKQTNPADLTKFKVPNWKLYKDHLEHLDKEYIEPVKSTFDQLVGYNEALVQMQIKNESGGPKIDFEELGKVMSKARAGLAKWIQENVHRESTRGMFSWRN